MRAKHPILSCFPRFQKPFNEDGLPWKSSTSDTGLEVANGSVGCASMASTSNVYSQTTDTSSEGQVGVFSTPTFGGFSESESSSEFSSTSSQGATTGVESDCDSVASLLSDESRSSEEDAGSGSETLVEIAQSGLHYTTTSKGVSVRKPVCQLDNDPDLKKIVEKNFHFVKVGGKLRLYPKQTRRRDDDGFSSQPDGNRRDDSDSSWHSVESKRLKSLSSQASLKEFINASDATRIQSGLPKGEWTEKEYETLGRLSTFFAMKRMESEECKKMWLRFDKVSKKKHNSVMLVNYILAAIQNGLAAKPEVSDAEVEWLRLSLEEIVPGITTHLVTVKRFLESLQECEKEPKEPLNQSKPHKTKGGQKKKGFERRRLEEWEGDLNQIGFRRRPQGQLKEVNESDDEVSPTQSSSGGESRGENSSHIENQTHDGVHVDEANNESVLLIKLKEWYEKRKSNKSEMKELLPPVFRVRDGDLYVVAHLFEQDIGMLSDREHVESPFIYSMELFKKIKVRNKAALRPYHEIDKDFPKQPLLINATQLVELAGRRWAGRPDDEAKRSLLSHGFENPYSLPFLAKLNLPRKSAIRILDIVLGDSSDAKVWMPEPIITAGTNFKAIGGLRRARIFVRPGYERTVRAYSLLNMYVDHFIPWITQDTLEQAVDKRLTCQFNLANFERFRVRIEEVVKTLQFGSGLDDVRPNDFVHYAKQAIRRKHLTEGQGCEWMAAADFIKQNLEDGNEAMLLDFLEFCLRCQMGIFIKDEEYAKWGTTLRFIVNPLAFVKVFFGTAFRDVEERLYFDDRSPLKKHLIKGLPMGAVKAKIMHLKPKRGQKYAETDYSAFEGSQSKESLDVEYRVYLSHCSEQSLRYKIINLVRLCNESDIVLTNKYFKVDNIPMRWSGMPNTACGNALMNYINLVACCGLDPNDEWYIEGDDGILVVDIEKAAHMMENSLYPLTLQLADSWNELSFCGHHYDLEGNREISRDELVRKVCTYFSPNPIGRRKAWELLWMRFLSLQISYPANPYLDELIDEANREYSDVRNLGVRQKTVDQWYRENWWRFENRGEDIDMPRDMTIIPKFHDIYLRCIQKADQRGEVLTPKKQVGYLNYALQNGCVENSHLSVNISNCLLSFLDGTNRIFHRLKGESKRSMFFKLVSRSKPLCVTDRDEQRLDYHDFLVDKLNQSKWYRKMSRTLGWNWLCYSKRQSLFSERLEYSSEREESYTAAYNHEMNKYLSMTNTARKWLDSHGRVDGRLSYDVEVRRA